MTLPIFWARDGPGSNILGANCHILCQFRATFVLYMCVVFLINNSFIFQPKAGVIVSVSVLARTRLYSRDANDTTMQKQVQSSSFASPPSPNFFFIRLFSNTESALFSLLIRVLSFSQSFPCTARVHLFLPQVSLPVLLAPSPLCLLIRSSLFNCCCCCCCCCLNFRSHAAVKVRARHVIKHLSV